jgi:agmatine deiminase
MIHHPKAPFFDQLTRPASPAAQLGYRMPGEFEPLEAVWLTYPHNPETWPGCLERAQAQYEFFIEELARFTRVQLINRQHGLATDDSWVRDYGPIFVVNDQGSLALHDFAFNGWGGKYGGEYSHDDLIPQHIARLLNLPLWVHDLLLEGGSIDVNGKGTVLTTRQCLLNPNRNNHLTLPQIEHHLHAALGTRHIIWLPGGIVGDDTDGHIDDVARFVAPGAVVAIRAPKDHPDHEPLEANWNALKQAVDQDGQPLELFELPVPEPILYDFPPDRFGPGGLGPVPASYANFLIVNEAVLVPTFGRPSDDIALKTIERALPGRTAIGIRSEWLVVGLGALHCLSQQQPRV